MNAIEVKELTKVYKGGKSKIEVTALNNFSLSVSKGEIFGLLGPNGAGKTTLIKTLLGIVQPTTGSAKLLGKPISDYRIKNRIGFLPEMGRDDDLTTTKEAYIIETQTPISPDFVNAKYASPSSAEASFDNISIKLESSKKLSVNVKDNLELNFVIDSLRKNGINIKTISIQKNSLEELFVSLITDERGGKK
jgi:ABC-type cobalamin/Fe3+-siderophores transport system ATPase subunit